MEQEQNTNTKVLISSKIPKELEEKIKVIAGKEKRTLSNVIYFLLESHPALANVKEDAPATV